MDNNKQSIVFVSNFMNHHQLNTALEMSKLYNYVFIATEPIAEEQVKMQYEDMNKKYDFILCSYESEENYSLAIEKINNADVVVFGSCPFEMVKNRIEQNKLTFRYSERIFKNKPIIRKFHPKMWKKYYWQCGRYKNKNYYLLCSGAFVAKDYAFFKSFKNKTYKWGYFPPVEKLDINKIVEEKRKNIRLNIIWCNRLIKVKNPQMAIYAAKFLKEKGINFEIDIIGLGCLMDKIKKMAKKHCVEKYINFLGSMPTEKVREYLKKADIALLTAGGGDGWGAVVNEAMNSCCSVLCNKFTGSVPFLVKDKENGLIYKDNKEFYEKLSLLVENRELREKLGVNAYSAIVNNWSPKVAVERFDKLVKAIQNGQEVEFTEGPCSRCS